MSNRVNSSKCISLASIISVSNGFPLMVQACEDKSFEHFININKQRFVSKLEQQKAVKATCKRREKQQNMIIGIKEWMKNAEQINDLRYSCNLVNVFN